MALMMDNKPTEYKGEALVWEKLSSLLPNDVVVYNHREVVVGTSLQGLADGSAESGLASLLVYDNPACGRVVPASEEQPM